MTSLDLAPERNYPALFLALEGVLDAACGGGARQTGALEGRPCPVLCAPPIVDPVRQRAVAVFYLQNEGLKNAFGEVDWAWMHTYARTLGRALAAAFRGGWQ